MPWKYFNTGVVQVKSRSLITCASWRWVRAYRLETYLLQCIAHVRFGYLFVDSFTNISSVSWLLRSGAERAGKTFARFDLVAYRVSDTTSVMVRVPFLLFCLLHIQRHDNLSRRVIVSIAWPIDALILLLRSQLSCVYCHYYYFAR